MPVVDVSFRLHGNLLPADHGYQLFSAIAKLIPELHGDSGIGLHPISGRSVDNRCVALNENSHLSIRLDSSHIKRVLIIAGKKLKIGEHEVRVGVPQTRALVPRDRLFSRLVIIKGFMEPEPFLEAACRQLDTLNVKGRVLLVEQTQVVRANENKQSGSHSPFVRRTMRIHDKEVVGFALRVDGLDPHGSIRLQEKGIGGRRRFGCGVFIADRK